jgi:hypothetical protein
MWGGGYVHKPQDKDQLLIPQEQFSSMSEWASFLVSSLRSWFTNVSQVIYACISASLHASSMKI